MEEAGADVAVRDRWGNTPLDEATRVGARPCAQYLEKRLQACVPNPRNPKRFACVVTLSAGDTLYAAFVVSLSDGLQGAAT